MIDSPHVETREDCHCIVSSLLDAKGLAICGLLILGEDPSGFQNPKDLAVETFKKAREIAPHAGIVKSVLRLFDELAKCDKDGVLKDVRGQWRVRTERAGTTQWSPRLRNGV